MSKLSTVEGLVLLHLLNGVDGDIINVGPLDIGRELYLFGGIHDPEAVVIGGTQTVPLAPVKPPCPCAPDEILDIAAIVGAAKNNNQNSDIDLDTNALSRVFGPVNVDFGCGRYYLDRIDGLGTVTLRADGPTALFIGGDFNLTGDLDLVLEQSGEIDVFIAGNLELTGISDVWDTTTRPSAVRFYVGGKREVRFSNIYGFNIYAPHAQVTLSTDASGSIFAKSFLSLDDTSIHYDRDICKSGQYCDGEDVGDGTCGPAGYPCETDEACCEPLICMDDECQPLVII